MKDNDFINGALSWNVRQDDFSHDLSLFSHYISLFNKDYYYNETYINEYVLDFYSFVGSVNRKSKIYHAIESSVTPLLNNEEFCLILDNSYRIYRKNNSVEHEYMDIDIAQINKTSVSINLKTGKKQSYHCFCTQLRTSSEIKQLYYSIKEFLNNKEIYHDA